MSEEAFGYKVPARLARQQCFLPFRVTPEMKFPDPRMFPDLKVDCCAGGCSREGEPAPQWGDRQSLPAGLAR